MPPAALREPLRGEGVNVVFPKSVYVEKGVNAVRRGVCESPALITVLGLML